MNVRGCGHGAPSEGVHVSWLGSPPGRSTEAGAVEAVGVVVAGEVEDAGNRASLLLAPASPAVTLNCERGHTPTK